MDVGICEEPIPTAFAETNNLGIRQGDFPTTSSSGYLEFPTFQAVNGLITLIGELWAISNSIQP